MLTCPQWGYLHGSTDERGRPAGQYDDSTDQAEAQPEGGSFYGGVQIRTDQETVSTDRTDQVLAACENRRFSGGRKTQSSGKLKGRGRSTNPDDVSTTGRNAAEARSESRESSVPRAFWVSQSLI